MARIQGKCQIVGGVGVGRKSLISYPPLLLLIPLNSTQHLPLQVHFSKRSKTILGLSLGTGRRKAEEENSPLGGHSLATTQIIQVTGVEQGGTRTTLPSASQFSRLQFLHPGGDGKRGLKCCRGKEGCGWRGRLSHPALPLSHSHLALSIQVLYWVSPPALRGKVSDERQLRSGQTSGLWFQALLGR